MKNVLIISGHTNLANNSEANKTIIEELIRTHPEYQIDLLSELYRDYIVDVAAEQEKLKWANVIVLQFPVFWYSMPSLLRKWIEDGWCMALPMAQRAPLCKERNSLHHSPQALLPNLTAKKALWDTLWKRFLAHN